MYVLFCAKVEIETTEVDWSTRFYSENHMCFMNMGVNFLLLKTKICVKFGSMNLSLIFIPDFC